MTHPKHIIWDWNGTLIDDAWLCVEILNTFLAEQGLDSIDHVQYREVFDFPVRNYYRRLGFDFSKESFEDIADRYIEIYNARRFECRLHRDAHRVIRAFADAGVGQSILSAYEQTSLEQFVDHFGLTDSFEQILGLDNYLAGGKLDNGRRLIDRLGHKGSEAVLIGDTTHDLDVARVIGVDCLLLVGGHQSLEKLENHGARVIQTLAETQTLLD